MKKKLKIYDIKDPAQYDDDIEYWKRKTPAEKVRMLEKMRNTWLKINGEKHGDEQGLQRVLRIIEPE